LKGRSREASIAASRFRRRDLAEPLQPLQLLGVEVVDVGDVGDQTLVQKPPCLLLAQALDVHRALADEMLDVLETTVQGSRCDWGRS